MGQVRRVHVVAVVTPMVGVVIIMVVRPEEWTSKILWKMDLRA